MSAAADLLGPLPESNRRRMARLRAKAEAPFIRNEYGLWCPQCGEQIADWEWVGDCDCCGYPSEIEEAFA
jgi:hypothetical protein